jgi:hypothetical protein
MERFGERSTPLVISWLRLFSAAREVDPLFLGMMERLPFYGERYCSLYTFLTWLHWQNAHKSLWAYENGWASHFCSGSLSTQIYRGQRVAGLFQL